MIITNILVIGHQIPTTIRAVLTTSLELPAYYYTNNIERAISILSKQQIHILLLDASELRNEDMTMIQEMNLPCVFIDTITETETDVFIDGFLDEFVREYSLTDFIKSLTQIVESTEIESEQPFFYIKYENIYQKININDLYWIESDGNYAMLNFSDRKYALKISLVKLYENLPSNIFLRIHKKFVINTLHIKGVNPTSNEIYLAEGTFPIGRTYKVDVFKYFKLIY